MFLFKIGFIVECAVVICIVVLDSDSYSGESLIAIVWSASWEGPALVQDSST